STEEDTFMYDRQHTSSSHEVKFIYGAMGPGRAQSGDPRGSRHQYPKQNAPKTVLRCVLDLTRFSRKLVQGSVPARMILSSRIETMLSKAFAPLVKWARYCDWSGRGAGMACAGDISTRDQVRGGGPQSFAREGARAPRRSLGTSPRAKMTDHR